MSFEIQNEIITLKKNTINFMMILNMHLQIIHPFASKNNVTHKT